MLPLISLTLDKYCTVFQTCSTVKIINVHFFLFKVERLEKIATTIELALYINGAL